MRKIKKLVYAIVAFTFITSCNKENIETEEMNILNVKLQDSDPLTLSNMVNLEMFETDRIINKNLQGKENSGVEYFSLENIFTENICVDISEFENFNEFESPYGYNNTAHWGVLNEFTNDYNIGFEPGDVIPNVDFESFTTIGAENKHLIFAREDYLTQMGHESDVIISWGFDKPQMHITFRTDDVLSVSMELYTLNYPYVIVDTYGDSGLLSSIEIEAFGGQFLGIRSEVPITKIVLRVHNEYTGWQNVALDNFYYATCDLDDDDDGILDENDAHPNSNMSEEISFGGFYPGVANTVLSNGSTMADEVDDLIAEIWAKINSGDMSRYYNPQLDFQREMTYVLAKWYRTERVITDREKTKIVRCVRSSRIFEDRN